MKRMTSRYCLVLFFVMLLPSLVMAEIYQWKESDGTVHFSDKPNPEGQAVELNEPQTYSAPTVEDEEETNEGAVPDPQNQKINPLFPGAQQQEVHYQSLSITQPHNEETLRNNAGNVDVTVALEPPLGVGHRVVVYVDGIEAATTEKGLRLVVPNVFRGKHSLVARVLDDNNQILIESSSVVIYMQRVTLGFKENKKNETT